MVLEGDHLGDIHSCPPQGEKAVLTTAFFLCLNLAASSTWSPHRDICPIRPGHLYYGSELRLVFSYSAHPAVRTRNCNYAGPARHSADHRPGCAFLIPVGHLSYGFRDICLFSTGHKGNTIPLLHTGYSDDPEVEAFVFERVWFLTGSLTRGEERAVSPNRVMTVG